MAKLDDKTKLEIIADHQTGKYSYEFLGKKYKVSRTTIGRIVNPDAYQHEAQKNKERQQVRRYHEQIKKQLTFRLYAQDQELIDHLEQVTNVNEYLKNLIRDDMKRNNS